MSDPNTPPFDLTRAHRWFAVEANNLAWDLLERPDRTPAEDERLIHAAHAAAFHWSHIGTILNTLRAEVLLATACFAANWPGETRHVVNALASLKEAGDAATPFDRASCIACAATIFDAANGDPGGNMLAQAKAAANELRLSDPDDVPVLEKFWPIVR